MRHVTEMELPEGSVPQNSVMIVAYFDSEGVTRYGFQFAGDTTLAMVLGLLELVKDDAKRLSAGW
jgi:hypothetical protein